MYETHASRQNALHSFCAWFFFHMTDSGIFIFLCCWLSYHPKKKYCNFKMSCKKFRCTHW